MRARAGHVFTLLAILLLAGCDKVYFARIDIGRPASQSSEVPGRPLGLSPAEQERVVAVFFSTARELSLTCNPTEFTFVLDSYDRAQYRLTSCSRRGEYTQLQLAVATQHVTVELYQVSGFTEPLFFRQCRLRFAERLAVAVGSDRLVVRYPYHWTPKVPET